MNGSYRNIGLNNNWQPLCSFGDCTQRLPCFLCINQIVETDFLGAIVDVVHGIDQSHLVVGFENFCDAFGVSHLGGEALHHLVGLAVDLLQVGVERSI